MKNKFICACAYIILCAALASSCKVQTKIVTEYRDRIVHDTTQVVDSIYQDRVRYVYTKGDTVYRTDSVFLYKYKYLNHDINVYVHDSIPYPVEIEVPVKYRSGYDRFCSFAFWIIFALVLLWIAWKIVKLYFHRL